MVPVSWEASAWAMAKGKQYELQPTTRFVMLTLANYADKEGNDIYPSLKTLEGDTGLEETTIRRHIKTLISVGLLDYGDQSIVANNPKYRKDRLPKVYRFVFHRAGDAPDMSNFGLVPSGSAASSEHPRGSTVRGGNMQGRTEETLESGADDPASCLSRGGKRGGTVPPKPINVQETSDRHPCRQCRLPVRAEVLNTFGLCPDCIPAPPAEQPGTGFAQYRAIRQSLAGSKAAEDVK